jgi:hypothetical protein
MMPGIVSSSRVLDIALLNQAPGFLLLQKRATSFSLDLGGAFEVYPSRRTILRFDFGERLILFQDRKQRIASNSSFIQGEVTNSLQMSTGVSFRLGKMSSVEPQPQRETGKFEIGAQFATLHLIENATFELRSEPGFGGRFTYNFNKYFAADSEVDYFPRNPHVGGSQDGGKILEGLIGVKAGIRQRRVGAFVKARPGLLSFGRTAQDFSQLPTVPITRLTHFALDLGGVVEVYTPKRTFLRFDLGNTLVVVRETTVTRTDGTTAIAPGHAQNTMSMSTGFGFRF